jgi:Fe-S cluster assembly iron-binding protein IscA
MSDKRKALVLSGFLLGCVLDYVHERQKGSFNVMQPSLWLCFGVRA